MRLQAGIFMQCVGVFGRISGHLAEWQHCWSHKQSYSVSRPVITEMGDHLWVYHVGMS